MVSIFSQTDKDSIASAIEKAEQQTSAEIVVVVTPASDSYLDFILLHGLLLSAILTVSLWASHTISSFPELLTLQLAVLLLLFFVPALRRTCLRFVPKKILHQRSARRALEEYHTVHSQLPATAPIVLLFISLDEHYAHILCSRPVSDKLSNETWSAIIAEFAQAMHAGRAAACIKAIEHIGVLLAQHFPHNGDSYDFSNQVIEK